MDFRYGGDLTEKYFTEMLNVHVSTVLSMLHLISLIPRPLPAFQCCMQKSERAWYQKSRDIHTPYEGSGGRRVPGHTNTELRVSLPPSLPPLP